jgi:hypothetical protein
LIQKRCELIVYWTFCIPYGGACRYLLALLLCSAAGFSAWFTWLVLPPISGFAMRLCALTTFLGAAETKPMLFVSFRIVRCFVFVNQGFVCQDRRF